MSQRTKPSAPPPYPFVFHSIRRVTSPEDEENGRTVYCGSAPATSFLGLDDNENVREYLLDAEGKKRRKPTQVLRAIRETLDENPHNFSILNSGITLVARGVEVDEKVKTAKLLGASIINGSQTRGELREYFGRRAKSGEAPFPVHVNYQLVVTDDDDLIAEISIARNFQNDVMTLSIAGRRGQLDELEESFQRTSSEAKLQKSETKLSDDYVKTEKLLQVITALVPASLWPKTGERENPNKVYTYSMKSKCLKDFQNLHDAVHRDAPPPDEATIELYQFFLDVCAEAWDLYNKWKCHQGFRGTRLHSIERENGEIKDVPDGIVFPILSALSAFAVKIDSKWTIRPPARFTDADLIDAAKQAYQQMAASNPWNMGKSRACYSHLYQIASIFQRLSQPR